MTPVPSLSTRLRLLVDHGHGGSVNAAAKDIGIPQQTLGKIVSGEVNSPRIKALQAIARFYGVSIGWLVAGEGDATTQVWAAKVAGATARLQRLNVKADTQRREIEQLQKRTT